MDDSDAGGWWWRRMFGVDVSGMEVMEGRILQVEKKSGLKELPTSCKVRDLYREGGVFNEFGNGRDTHEAGT